MLKKILFFITIVFVGSACYARQNGKVVEVTVQEAGTLERQISNMNILPTEIRYLTVNGSINGYDIVYLRYLAGKRSYDEKVNYDAPMESTPGQLVSLDLSKASIVASTNYYYDKQFRYAGL